MNELLRPDDTRDALRKIGALLFGIGVLMLLLRKATIAGDYSRGVILIILLVPFTRLAHFIVAPLDYLVRPYQQVIWNWNRRHIRNAQAWHMGHRARNH